MKYHCCSKAVSSQTLLKPLTLEVESPIAMKTQRELVKTELPFIKMNSAYWLSSSDSVRDDYIDLNTGHLLTSLISMAEF